MKHTEAFENLVAEIRPQIKEVQLDDVLQMQKDGKEFVFMDVREDHEWLEGRAYGAVHLG